MIVDSSALVAILFDEPEGEQFFDLALSGHSRMSAASLLEVAIVVDGTGDAVKSRRLDDLVQVFEIEIVDVTAEQARIGREAYRDFGRGSGHPARLNFGDCFSYALAKVTGEPLLFKGDDFIHTDLASATG